MSEQREGVLRMDSPLAAYVKRLEESAKGTFWEYIGANLSALDASRVVITLSLQPHHLNHMGIMHGGVHATLLDSAMGLAAMASRPKDRIVTTNLNIHYLAPVDGGGVVTVTSEVLHISRKLITTQGQVFNEKGELCAHGTGTFRVIVPQKGV
jgi:uncharacterized protein (TIGR00369 family)